MDSLELDAILRRNPVTRNVYCGVHPADKIPVIRHFPCAMIVNLDKASEPGTHWVAMYAPNQCTLRYFDSFGGTCDGPIKEYINKNFLFVRRQTCQIQSPASDACGYYALMFLYLSAAKEKYEDVFRTIARQPNPDAFVKRYVLQNVIV